MHIDSQKMGKLQGKFGNPVSDSFGGLRLDGDDQAKEAHRRRPSRQLAWHEGKIDLDNF